MNASHRHRKHLHDEAQMGMRPPKSPAAGTKGRLRRLNGPLLCRVLCRSMTPEASILRCADHLDKCPKKTSEPYIRRPVGYTSRHVFLTPTVLLFLCGDGIEREDHLFRSDIDRTRRSREDREAMISLFFSEEFPVGEIGRI